MFYEQLLSAQIPKAQKRLTTLLFFALLGSERAKELRKMLMKLTLGLPFRKNTF